MLQDLTKERWPPLRRKLDLCDLDRVLVDDKKGDDGVMSFNAWEDDALLLYPKMALDMLWSSGSLYHRVKEEHLPLHWL